MRLTAVLLSALAFCLVGFVFAVHAYARPVATAPAARVTPVLQPSAPPAGFNPVPSSTPLAPPEPAAVPSPEVQAPAAPAAAAGPIALAPQPVEARPPPPPGGPVPCRSTPGRRTHRVGASACRGPAYPRRSCCGADRGARRPT